MHEINFNIIKAIALSIDVTTLLFNVRASTSVDVNIYKIQKVTNFTYFTPKIFPISPSKTVHIYTFATVTVHIYTVIVVVYSIILLISHFTPFFLSLLHLQNQLVLLLSLIIFFFL